MLIDMLAKSSRSSRVVLSVVIVVILLACAYNWVLAPHTKYLHAAKQYSSVAGDVDVKNRIIKSKIAVKKKELEKLQSGFDGIRSQLFTPADSKEFFRSLGFMAEQSGCVIDSLNFVSKKSVGNEGEEVACIAENGAVVTFVGSYANLMKLFEKIEAKPERITVPSISMTALEGRSDLLECEVIFRVYVAEDASVFAGE